MNRDELLNMLAGLVEEGRISRADAEVFLDRFDRGEISDEDLPLSADDTNPEASNVSQLGASYAVGAKDWAQAPIASDLQRAAQQTGTNALYEAMAAGAFLSTTDVPTSGQVIELGVSAVSEAADDVITLRLGPASVDEALQSANQILGSMSEAAAQQTAVEITASFEEKARALARALKDNRLSIAQWQDEMMSLIREDILAQAQTGAGRLLSPGELRRLQQRINQQAAYLRRFTEEIAARAEADDAMSLGQIRERARQYGGHGYEEYYRAAEAELEAGYVVDYNAVDDERTCVPCIEAESNSPYLPGEGPMPGGVCLGRGKCRCTRTRRYAPDEYEDLR